MPNNFSTDVHCVAVYRLESGALTADSKGLNTLTNRNGVSESLADKVEGSCCASFVNASHQLLYIDDANQSMNWPFKSGQHNNKASMCFWIKRAGSNQGFIGGRDTATWNFRIEPNGEMSVWVKGSVDWTVATLQAGQWYHVGFTLDGFNGSYTLKIVKASDGSVQRFSATRGSAVSITANPFVLGASSSTATSLTFDGLIDECVIFNDILTEVEIDAIRTGTYIAPTISSNNFSGDSSVVALYKFEESSNLGLDSLGFNSLDDQSAGKNLLTRGDFKEGLSSLWFSSSTYYPRLANASLNANFPLKSTQVAPDFSIACWFKVDDLAAARYIWSKYYPGYSSTICAYLNTSGQLSIQKAIDSTTGRENYIIPVTIATNRWYHLTVAYDYLEKTLYVYLFDSAGNVLSAAATPQNSNIYLSTREWRLGGYADVIGTTKLGLDELVVFNRVISQEEALEICQGTFGSGPPIIPPPTEIRAIRSDISGNARHMSDSGTTATGNVKGKIGNAVYFSGAGQQLLMLTSAPDFRADQEFTIAFRMKPHLNSNPVADIYWHFKVGDLEIRAGFASGQTKAFVSASTPSLFCRTGNVILADTFSYIAIYFDTSGLYIDVNNACEASQAGAHTGIITSAPGIEVGISAAIEMNISIDELGMWVGLNALNAAQRTTLYSGNYGQRPSFN